MGGWIVLVYRNSNRELLQKEKEFIKDAGCNDIRLYPNLMDDTWHQLSGRLDQ